MSGVIITPANSPLRKFCGCCGTCFEEGQLLPTFKYCMHCGNDLAPWLINAISTGMLPATPPTTPTANRQIAQLQTDHEIIDQEMEDVSINESGDSIVSPGRGRGESRTRRRRFGGGRGRMIEPLTLTPLAENENFGRGMRSVTRPDYSVKRYFRNTLYGKPKKNDAQHGAKNYPILSLTELSLQKGRQNSRAPCSPSQVTSCFECC